MIQDRGVGNSDYPCGGVDDEGSCAGLAVYGVGHCVVRTVSIRREGGYVSRSARSCILSDLIGIGVSIDRSAHVELVDVRDGHGERGV